jgi:porin
MFKKFSQNSVSLAISCLLAISVCAASAKADDAKPDFSSNNFSGDWGGLRTSLYDRGYDFEVSYALDTWRNLSGGVTTGNRVLDNLNIIMDVDGEKALGLTGSTFHVYFLNNMGGKPNVLVGTNAGIDNIETATHAFKLYEAWYQQNFLGDRVSVLAGLHDLNSEFYVTDTSGLFLNPTYGIGTEMAATGDNGPSIFPNTSLALRIAVKPTDITYVQAAIYDGVPQQSNNQRGTHVNFDDKDGALWVAETGVHDKDIGHFGVGVWKYTAKRPDQLTGDMTHSKGVYMLADKSIYNDGGRDISAFGRVGLTAGDIEQFKSSWSLGAVGTGFIASRPEGQVGLAVSAAINSDKYRTANAPVDKTETQVELTYADKLTPWLSVQPDIQYTVNPGTDPTLDNAWTVGVRFGVEF